MELKPDIKLVIELAAKREVALTEFINRFIDQSASDEEIDAMVWEVGERVMREIDCTACAFCCHLKEYAVGDDALVRHATLVGMTLEQFLENYTVRHDEGLYIIEDYHCAFLRGGSCEIYEERPQVCRDYPNLEKNFRSRINLHLENMHRCSIVYYTLELLCEKYGNFE
jgi:uncharacterized protein